MKAMRHVMAGLYFTVALVLTFSGSLLALLASIPFWWFVSQYIEGK